MSVSNERDCLFCKYDNGKTARQGYEYPCNLCDGYSHFEEYVPDTNVGEWISVEDRLPDRDGRYLVAMKNGDNYHISTRKFRRANPPIWWKGHTFGYWARYTGGVRYWAPLPEPPKGE